jgi:hypothetical protein
MEIADEAEHSVWLKGALQVPNVYMTMMDIGQTGTARIGGLLTAGFRRLNWR